MISLRNIKHILFFIFFIVFTIMPTQSAVWQEISPKTYVDVSSIKYGNNCFYGWFKLLAYKPQKIGNEQLWYTIEYGRFSIDNPPTYQSYLCTAYNTNGDVIYNMGKEPLSKIIVPNSRLETVYSYIFQNYSKKD